MVLLLALIVIAAGGMLVMGFLQVASDRSVTAQTFVISKRAEFIAESGVAEACYWLRHPEWTSRTVWTGVSGRRPDPARLDFYNVTVTRDAVDPLRYKVNSEGHAVDAAGERMVRTVAEDFRVYYGFTDAIMASKDVPVPACVTIQGNVYATGSVTNAGTIDGSVWAGGSITNAGTISGLSTPNCPLRSIGVYTISPPVMYTYDSHSYAAQGIVFEMNVDQTWSSNPGNPMGVYWRNGNLRLFGTTTIDGTLVVSGDLELQPGSTTVITPKPGFPALVVKNNFKLKDGGISATINGAVIVQNDIQATSLSSTSSLTINGPLVFPNDGKFGGAFPAQKVVINYDPTRADVSGLFPAQPRPLAGGLPIAYHADGL
jgi:hypothetical protein